MSKRFRADERTSSLMHALRGVRTMIAEEHSSPIHLAWSAGVIGLGLALDLSLNEWRWLLLAAALIWVTEALNTAIERLGDAVTLERDPRVGQAKDVAAASVLLASVAAALIGLSVFAPYLLRWLAQ